MKKPFIKTISILLIIGLNWAAISAIGWTQAYFNDAEMSLENTFSAGTLDFILTSSSGFDPSGLQIGESATRTISFENNGNIPKYKVSAANFSGLLCDYLNLEANLDGDGIEYAGKLTDFNFGPVIFSEPDDWFFTLTLPSDTPEDLIGENCQFNFVFFGSQVRNDLPFGQGFSDTEEENNNVTAKICYDAETRSKGYWKNHSEAFVPYLPQMLGDESVDTVSEAVQILNYNNNSSSMRNKLRGQLLAMKFNIAHFKIGEYVPPTSTDNLNQIVAQADDLLQQVPAPSDETLLETMKNLLDGLNQDLQFRTCSGSLVKVIIPNGGEVWRVGQHYDLTWTTKNLVCPNDSIISIWYSKDSGATWGNVVTSTENDGVYSWMIPLYLEEGTYYVPSSRARIKVVTRCSETLLVNGWDMSDADFCPPIDYDLLTPEEIEIFKSLGLEEVIEEVLADGDSADDNIFPSLPRNWDAGDGNSSGDIDNTGNIENTNNDGTNGSTREYGANGGDAKPEETGGEDVKPEIGEGDATDFTPEDGGGGLGDE